jgi:hypothetical protein
MHTKQAHPAAAALASGRPAAQAHAPATTSAKTPCILLTLRIAAVACFSAGSILAYFVASQWIGMLSLITPVHFSTHALVVDYAVCRPNSYVVCFVWENVQACAMARVSDNV